MGHVEAVAVVVGDSLPEEGLEFLRIGLGGGRVGVAEDGLELEEDFLELQFPFQRVDGDVREGGDAGVRREVRALVVAEGFRDGAAAGLGDIGEQSALTADGKDFGKVGFHDMLLFYSLQRYE